MAESKRIRLSKADREAIYDMYAGHCAYCGEKITLKDMQVDHMQPLRKGGADELSNMVPACRSCNHYKSTLTVDQFREYLSRIHSRLLRDSVAYRVAERFGIVKYHPDPIVFYFEKGGKRG